MYSVICDTQQIEALLKDFYVLANIKMSFVSFDRRVRVYYQTQSLEDNFNFCSILRGDNIADLRCRECDQNAFNIACKTKSVYIYKCHAGLIEVLTPIIVENKPVGYIIMGKILSSPPTQEIWNEVFERCKQYDVDFDKLKEAFFMLRSMSNDKIEAATSIVNMCAKYIHMSKLAKIQQPLLIEQIKDYIECNYDRDITISEMSNYFQISKSHLSRMIKKQFNMTFTEYLLNNRIEKAKALLEETNAKVKYIALSSGFEDHNYFSRAFKKLTGYTPTEYRIHARKNSK